MLVQCLSNGQNCAISVFMTSFVNRAMPALQMTSNIHSFYMLLSLLGCF